MEVGIKISWPLSLSILQSCLPLAKALWLPESYSLIEIVFWDKSRTYREYVEWEYAKTVQPAQSCLVSIVLEDFLY